MRIRNILTAGMLALFASLSGSAAAWVVNEDFDNQSVGARCATFWADTSDITVTNTLSSSGSNSCKFAVGQGGTAFGGGFNFPAKLKRYGEYWVRFRLFMPHGFIYGSYGAGDRQKFIRITTRDAAGGAPARLDVYWNQEGVNPPYAQILESSSCGSNCWTQFGAGDAQVRGIWETYEMFVKFDNIPVSAGGQARIRVWKNNKLIGDITDKPTLNSPTDESGNTMIFSYWNGGSPATQELYFDDLVATNITPAGRDSHGNPFIGMGSFVAVAPPNPPGSIQ